MRSVPDRRMTLLAVLTWCVVVAVTASLVWVAITRAGRGVSTVALPATASATTSSPATSTSSHATTTSSPTGTSASSSSRSSTTASSASPRPRPQSTTVTGGTVTVACDGSRITLRGAAPAVGWSVESDTGGDVVEVKFRSGESETEVHARCVAGTARFETES
jgi:cytoskeletal protein RodZ